MCCYYRDREPRSHWVYSVPEPSKVVDSEVSSQQQPQDSLQQQGSDTPLPAEPQQLVTTTQPVENSQLAPAEPVQLDASAPQHSEHHQDSLQSDVQLPHEPPLPPLPQQQVQQQHVALEQPPAVEFGPYFSTQPVRVYTGHTEDILDVSWSAAGFILTASLDKCVRLWHVSQPDCLREFWHTDFVTSVQFHPLDAQRFVSGAMWDQLLHTLRTLISLNAEYPSGLALAAAP